MGSSAAAETEDSVSEGGPGKVPLELSGGTVSLVTVCMGKSIEVLDVVSYAGGTVVSSAKAAVPVSAAVVRTLVSGTDIAADVLAEVLPSVITKSASVPFGRVFDTDAVSAVVLGCSEV